MFNQTTQKLARVFGVDTDKQRLASVHIKSNMRRLSRLGIFARSIHRFLVNLRRHYPEQFQALGQQRIEKYLAEKALSCFSMVKPSQSQKRIDEVSRDLFELVQRFKHDKNVCAMTSYKLLERVLQEQCSVLESSAAQDSTAVVMVKPAREIPSDSLQNPSDPDASYDGHKGQGYQVQVMETYSEEIASEKKEQTLNLITPVAVEPAHISAVHAVLPAIESSRDMGLAPQQILCDGAYGSDDNCQAAQQQGVKIIAPVKGTVENSTYDLSAFE